MYGIVAHTSYGSKATKLLVRYNCNSRAGMLHRALVQSCFGITQAWPLSMLEYAQSELSIR